MHCGVELWRAPATPTRRPTPTRWTATGTAATSPAPQPVSASTPPVTPSLQEQLLWKQREPILDAVEHPIGDANLLLVLGRDTLWAYAPAHTQMELRAVAHIPGPLRPSRSLAGRIHFPKLELAHFLVELPGKTCSGTFADKIALDCAPANAAKRLPVATPASAKLLAPCDYTAWTLSSDDGDWSKPDRLFLRDVRSPSSDRTAALEAPGPVLSLGSAGDFTSSTAVILNLRTGEYEVYRYTLACHN